LRLGDALGGFERLGTATLAQRALNVGHARLGLLGVRMPQQQ
jgi:hypothetical protein